MYWILTDEDVDPNLKPEKVIELIEQTFRSKAEGTLATLIRFAIGLEDGALVFTPGAETGFSNTAGFRVYDSFKGISPDRTQLVAVFDSRTGAFKGMVIGTLTGALRTAAINAVAIKYMARADVQTLGVLGSGFQASVQIQAAAAVRQYRRILVYSPTPAHREELAETMTTKLGIPVDAAESAESTVRAADVLICATTSQRPVFRAEWLRPGTHVNTIGPKFKDGHELPMEAAVRSRIIATDSLQQATAYSRPFFLEGTAERERMVELDQIVVGKQKGRETAEDVTLFCSVGLAGTEVVVADYAIRAAAGDK